MEIILIQFGTQKAFHIGEPSEIAAARRAGVTLANQLGFDELRTAQLALVITEAATNIAKHAKHGEILLRSLQRADATGVEVIAIDSGPGISNVELQMEDGNSTTGTYGVGLGAIGRLSQEFDMYSLPQQGTILRVGIWNTGIKPRNISWQIGAVCLPHPGENVCGDTWTLESDGNSLTFLLADGLGHGPDAAVASKAAAAVINDGNTRTPGMLVQNTHAALRGTRGAALAIGQIDPEHEQLRFAGVGNIAVSVFEESARRHLLSHNGIVGSNLRKLQEFSQSWKNGSLIIAHSDGIGTRWDLARYPGLMHCHPGLIAAVLYRDFTRGRDDVTVLVLREMKA